MQTFPDFTSRRRELRISLETSKKKRDQLQNNDNAKMKYLKTVDMEAYRAYEWIKENRDRFKRFVYGPIMNEVSFTHDNACKWFENTISRDIMLSFVTQCTEDYDFLIREVREKKNIRISVINVDVNTIQY